MDKKQVSRKDAIMCLSMSILGLLLVVLLIVLGFIEPNWVLPTLFFGMIISLLILSIINYVIDLYYINKNN